MSTIKEQQLAFLEETVNHYNLGNRCCTTKKGCRYSPITLGLEGVSEGDAIGRHLTPELAQSLDSNYDSIDNPDLYNQLPDEIISLGVDFLFNVQLLHDDKNNWSDTGLSGYGVDKVAEIKYTFGL